MATIHEFTKSVSIVTAGEQDARWFSAQYPGYEVVDLRRFLKKNPAESVAHKVDYHDAHTLMVVVGQDGYPDVMLHLIDRMEKRVDKLLIHCTSGWHRAGDVPRQCELRRPRERACAIEWSRGFHQSLRPAIPRSERCACRTWVRMGP